MKIFHVTVHLGGGIGRALSDTLIAEKERSPDLHRIYCLEKPENNQYVGRCRNNGIEVWQKPVSDELFMELSEGDLIIIHWWNHPLTVSFLLQFPPMTTRILFWIHVSGCTYPHLPFSLVDKMDITFFTTPYSFANPLWEQEQRETALKKAIIVYGLGEIQKMSIKQSYKIGKEFTIGYIGTVQESKLTPRIADYCMSVVKRVPSAHFIFVGKNELSEETMQELASRGLLKQITFAGYQQDIGSLLSGFDVFGYPLNPYHYGSTENALLESMSAGLPVVALKNSAESYIIQSGKNGLLASSAEEYGHYMELLFGSEKLRESLGSSASAFVRETFPLEKNVERFHKALKRAVNLSPRRYHFENIFGSTPTEYFLSCTGKEREIFAKAVTERLAPDDLKALPHIYHCRTKGSLSQFKRYFPDEVFFKNL